MNITVKKKTTPQTTNQSQFVTYLKEADGEMSGTWGLKYYTAVKFLESKVNRIKQVETESKFSFLIRFVPKKSEEKPW